MMVNKMNVYEIKFEPKSGLEMNEDNLDFISWYLLCLNNNGQILKNYVLTASDTYAKAIATLPEDGALDQNNNSVYAAEYLQKTEEVFCITTERIGSDVDVDEPCHCDDSGWYMLHTDWICTTSPVMCGDCGKRVPLYRFPHVDKEKDHNDVLYWAEMYKYIDSLEFMHERFALKQMNHPKSPLSKLGIDLCRKYEEVTKKPFYYFLHQRKYNRNKPFYYKPNKRCPICGARWRVVIEGSYIDCKCENCRIISYNKYGKEW